MFLFKKSAISDKVRCLRKEPSAEWSIEVLLLKMGKPSGGGKGGRPSGGGVIDGGKSTQDYVCAVCPAKVKGFHLKNHYKAKTNFVHLAKLKDGETFMMLMFTLSTCLKMATHFLMEIAAFYKKSPLSYKKTHMAYL